MNMKSEDITLEQLPSEPGEPYSYAATDNRTSITVVERHNATIGAKR